MEQIVNGLKYDTEKADLVASNEYWDGHNWDRDGRNTYLYKTENGRYFLLHTSRWEGERDRIEPVTTRIAPSHAPARRCDTWHLKTWCE